MQPIVIGPEQRAEIEAAIERAKNKPVPLSILKQTSINSSQAKTFIPHEKVQEVDLSIRPKSECVLLPFGVSVCYSVEQQPQGFCGHLSIMVGDGANLIPVPIALAIAEEFGMSEPFEGIWIEEVDPKSYAVNLVHCHAPVRIAGNA